MKTPVKLVIIFLAFNLIGCGTTKDLRGSKSAPKVVISSPVLELLGSNGLGRDWLMGDIVRVDAKRLDPENSATQLIVSPGIHEVEMRWRSARRPINGRGFSTENNLVPLYGVVSSVNSYRSSRTYTLTTSFEPDYRYYVDLSENIVNGAEFVVPGRLCLAKIRLSGKNVKKAPSGIIRILSRGSIVACSQ